MIIGWLNEALRSGDERQIATAARWYFERSALFLRITRGGSRGRAQLAARFQAFCDERYEIIIENWRRDVARARTRGRRPHVGSDD